MRKSIFIVLWMILTVVSIGFGAEEEKWISLFDGKTLTNWKGTKHFGTADIVVKDGVIVLQQGLMATSMKYTGKEELPRENYQIEYEARRTKGNDFFAALTFPVGKNFCTFINGGWGGSVVGLSSIDGMDASENNSSTFMEFKDKTWYKFRVAVTENSIRIWSNDQEVVSYSIGDSELSVRLEVEGCKPLGFSAWECQGEIKSIRYRKLTSQEIKANNEAAQKKESAAFH